MWSGLVLIHRIFAIDHIDMATAKLDDFTLRDNRVARYAKALAHPARVAILRLLAGRSTCVCGDLVHELPLSQSTVSQHLKELKEAGLVQGEIEGTRVCYCIDRAEWARALKAFEGLFARIAEQPDTCC